MNSRLYVNARPGAWLAALLGVLTLVACGGDAPPPAPVAVGGADGTELAARQVLHKGNGSEPATLDPHRAEGVPAANVLRDLYEGLTLEAPDGSVIPGAAKSWSVSDNGRAYRFRLRAGMKWSNGDPVTAADFEFGLKRSADPATLSKYSTILLPIENAAQVIAGELPADALGVTALSDTELEIRLSGPTPYLLGLLNHASTYPVHRPSLEQHGGRFARAGNLVGNGAYRLAEWRVQSHIRLVRNPEYRDDANTIIDEVWYHSIEDQNAELKRYRAGELDFSYALPYKQLGWIRENLPDELSIAPYLGSYYFGFNVTRPPFAGNRALRTALAMAVDRDILTGRVTNAGEVPAYGWVPPVTDYTGQRPEWAGWTQAQRNAEAQRLYREAGYGPDNPLEVEILYNTDQNHRRVSAAIAAMWKQVLGVRARLLNQEWKVFLQTRKEKVSTQVFRAGWIGDYNDPYTFAELMRSTNGLNDSGWRNAEYDALLDAAAAEPDADARMALLEQAERVLIEDLPIMPVYFYVTKRLVKPWVGGYQPNIMDHHYTKNFFILKH